MTTINSFSILFFLRKGLRDKNGMAPIFLRLTVGGKRCEISLKRKIQPSYWCSVSERVKASGTNPVHEEINRHIDQVKVRIYRIQSELVTLGKPYTASSIKVKFIGQDRPAKGLLAVYEEHNKGIAQLVGKSYSKGAYLRHVRTKNHLKLFLDKSFNQTDILLNEVNLPFINGFHHYLKAENIGNSNTTTKYVTNFKKIMRIAFANNWVQKDPFYHWKASWKKVDREILDENELQVLMGKELPIKRLEQVRDVFIFCCFTGLAYVDVKKLSKKHIVTGVDGNPWILMNRSKTDSRSSIPLLKPAKKILDKYSKTDLKPGESLLPVISNQKTNAFLKEISILCGISKNLTFHLARHTFATTVTLANGIPIESVSKMLGHQSLKTTQIYAKVVDTKLANDMKLIESKY